MEQPQGATGWYFRRSCGSEFPVSFERQMVAMESLSAGILSGTARLRQCRVKHDLIGWSEFNLSSHDSFVFHTVGPGLMEWPAYHPPSSTTCLRFRES